MCSDYVEPEHENEDIMNDGVYVLDEDLDEDIWSKCVSLANFSVDYQS